MAAHAHPKKKEVKIINPFLIPYLPLLKID